MAKQNDGTERICSTICLAVLPQHQRVSDEQRYCTGQNMCRVGITVQAG